MPRSSRLLSNRTILFLGIGPSPDKMLLARLVSYADAHRARLGVNYKQIPVNRPKAAVNSYSKGGKMRIDNVTDPVYAPNSKGGPQADPETLSGRCGLECGRRFHACRIHPAQG